MSSSENASDVMAKAKVAAKNSGKTYQEIGEAMGYPETSAKQSVAQFLRGKNPTVDMLMKFCSAIDIKVMDLL